MFMIFLDFCKKPINQIFVSANDNFKIKSAQNSRMQRFIQWSLCDKRGQETREMKLLIFLYNI